MKLFQNCLTELVTLFQTPKSIQYVKVLFCSLTFYAAAYCIAVGSHASPGTKHSCSVEGQTGSCEQKIFF